MNLTTQDYFSGNVFADNFDSILAEYAGYKNRGMLKSEMYERFDRLILESQKMDIDRESPMMSIFNEAVAYLALYKVLINYGVTLDNIVAIIHKNYISKIELRMGGDLAKMGEMMFSQANIDDYEHSLKKTKESLYADDYIVDFIPGGERFNYGNDTFQCPVNTFFKMNEGNDLIPHICDIDFIRSRYLKSGLTRDTCLSNGDSCCSFRWKKCASPVKVIEYKKIPGLIKIKEGECLYIREIDSSDVNQAKQVITEGLSEYFSNYDEAYNPDLLNFNENYIGREDSVFVVAVKNNCVIGTGAIVAYSEDTAQMVRISVKKEFRRKKIASAIVEYLENAAIMKGFSKIILETTLGWVAAEKLYTALGYTREFQSNGNVYFTKFPVLTSDSK